MCDQQGSSLRPDRVPDRRRSARFWRTAMVAQISTPTLACVTPSCREHVDLAFGCGSTVAAHHWHNIGVHAKRHAGCQSQLLPIDRQVGDATATRTNGHQSHLASCGQGSAGLDRVFHCRWNMGDFGSIEMLVKSLIMAHGMRTRRNRREDVVSVLRVAYRCLRGDGDSKIKRVGHCPPAGVVYQNDLIENNNRDRF